MLPYSLHLYASSSASRKALVQFPTAAASAPKVLPASQQIGPYQRVDVFLFVDFYATDEIEMVAAA